MTVLDGNRKYTVGFGKPPRSGQFKAGQSGNPEGARLHKKTIISPADEIYRLERDLVTITEQGKRKTIPKLEASLRLLMNRATKGSLPAGRELLRLLKMYSSDDVAQDRPLIVMSEDGKVFCSDQESA